MLFDGILEENYTANAYMIKLVETHCGIQKPLDPINDIRLQWISLAI